MAPEKTKTEAKDEKQPKTTVRKRKGNAKSNTQRFIPFAEIKSDTVLLKNGGLRAVLMIEPLNFNLKSETEQKGIIAGYEQFINTLTFPVQVIVRSTKVNIDPYIELLHEKANEHESTLLKEQTEAYADFVRKVVDVADIMQKRFYVIVPLDDAPQKKSTFNQFLKWLKLDDTLSKALQRSKHFDSASARLRERTDLVDTGLRNIGLIPRRLTTVELIELYYRIYNPELSQMQKFPKDGNINTAPNVL